VALEAVGAAVSLTAIAINGGLAAYILWLNPRGLPNRAFVLLLATFVVWDASEAVLRLRPFGPDLAAYEPWLRLEWAAISFIAGTMLHFFLAYPIRSPFLDRPEAYLVVYLPSLVIATLVGGSNLVVDGFGLGPLGPDARAGPWYLPAAVWFSAWLVVALYRLARIYLRTEARLPRQRAAVMLVAFLVAIIPGAITDIFWPLFLPLDTRLGLGTIYTFVIGAIIAYAIVRYGFLRIEAVRETPTREVPAPGLAAGRAHLFLAPDRAAAYAAFRGFLADAPGLCVTGLHPDRVEARFGLARTPVLWLTNATGHARAVKPGALEFEVALTVVRFVRGNPRTVVLLDDVGYLVHTLGLAAAARFLRDVRRAAAEGDATLLVAANPLVLDDGQRAALAGLFDDVHRPEGAPPPPSREDAAAALVETSSEGAWAVLAERVGGGDVLLVTTWPAARVRAEAPWRRAQVLEVGGPPQAATLETRATRDLVAYVRRAGTPVVAIHALEQIALVAPFPEVLTFVKDAVDQVHGRGGRLVATLDPAALDPLSTALLEDRFERVERPP
jgi:hypothetical protein